MDTVFKCTITFVLNVGHFHHINALSRALFVLHFVLEHLFHPED